MNEEIDFYLKKLKKSRFRANFSLKKCDFDYINEKGMETIKSHAVDFIQKRLAPKDIPNDGKQTPMKGHPVFIAQHATATCCRECLYKWYKISKDRELSETEILFVVDIIIAWIENQISIINF